MGPGTARSLPFFIYIGFLVAGGVLAPLLPDGRWLYGIQIAAVSIALAWLAREYRELRMPAGIDPGAWWTAIVVGVVVFLLWIHLDQAWATLGQARGYDPRNEAGEINWPLAMVRLFGAAVVVPVMEELFWRSFIQRWVDRPDFLLLSPARTSLRAVCITALLFGLEHTLWLAGIVAGIAYGGLYRRYGGLWLPIIAHGTTNLLLGLWVLTTGNWQFW
ncbi:MAG: CAAX prenyl protease-related protein [Rhodocyclaceae bacterium]|nr:MAG: CAAX prenyl protease-related protein [Rhodocyclaceae bacterium]